MPRDLAISCDRLDCTDLWSAWTWLVPADHTPLMRKRLIGTTMTLIRVGA